MMTVESAPRFASRRIYAVAGVPPEVMAYGMARYSRSASFGLRVGSSDRLIFVDRADNGQGITTP